MSDPSEALDEVAAEFGWEAGRVAGGWITTGDFGGRPCGYAILGGDRDDALRTITIAVYWASKQPRRIAKEAKRRSDEITELYATPRLKTVLTRYEEEELGALHVDKFGISLMATALGEQELPPTDEVVTVIRELVKLASHFESVMVTT